MPPLPTHRASESPDDDKLRQLKRLQTSFLSLSIESSLASQALQKWEEEGSGVDANCSLLSIAPLRGLVPRPLPLFLRATLGMRLALHSEIWSKIML